MKWSKIKQQHDLLSLAVAAFALLLSQFPPIYTLFHGPNFMLHPEVDLGLKPSITTGAELWKRVTITNSGEEIGLVKSATVLVVSEEGKDSIKLDLVACTDGQTGASGNSIWEPFKPFHISPNQTFSKMCVYRDNGNIRHFQDTQIINSRISQEAERWENKLKLNGWASDDASRPPFKSSNELHSALKTYMNRRSEWLTIGNYSFTEQIDTDHGTMTIDHKIEISKAVLKSFDDELDQLARVVFAKSINAAVLELNHF